MWDSGTAREGTMSCKYIKPLATNSKLVSPGNPNTVKTKSPNQISQIWRFHLKWDLAEFELLPDFGDIYIS